MRTMMEPDERLLREEQYRREREHLSSERESRIEKARRGEAPE